MGGGGGNQRRCPSLVEGNLMNNKLIQMQMLWPTYTYASAM